MILKSDGAKKLMIESGHKGVFAKRFLGQDQPPPTSDWKIVWLGQDISLETALDRGELLGLDCKGLSKWPWSTCTSSCICSGEKLLGESFNPAEDNSFVHLRD